MERELESYRNVPLIPLLQDFFTNIHFEKMNRILSFNDNQFKKSFESLTQNIAIEVKTITQKKKDSRGVILKDAIQLYY